MEALFSKSEESLKICISLWPLKAKFLNEPVIKITWKKTVKKTMAMVVVMKRFLLGDSSRRTSAKATPPRRPFRGKVKIYKMQLVVHLLRGRGGDCLIHSRFLEFLRVGIMYLESEFYSYDDHKYGLFQK